MDDKKLCARCGHDEDAHYALNLANGPYVSATVLVCPTATFKLAAVGELPRKKP